jgi:hypothetical protein
MTHRLTVRLIWVRSRSRVPEVPRHVSLVVGLLAGLNEELLEP